MTQMHIGVISYSMMAGINIHLSVVNHDASLLLDKIWEIEYIAGVTNTAEAFRALRDMIMT